MLLTSPPRDDIAWLAAGDATCEDQLAKTCNILQSGNVFIQLTTHFDDSVLFNSLALASSLINALFLLLMWQIKELHVHPMKLFMGVTACDAIMLHQYSVSVRVCQLDLQQLLAYTLFFSDDCASQLRAVQIITKFSLFVTLIFSCLGLCLQICICLDLILSIKRPFKDKETRIPWYFGVSLLFSAFGALIATFSDPRKERIRDYLLLYS